MPRKLFCGVIFLHSLHLVLPSHRNPKWIKSMHEAEIRKRRINTKGSICSCWDPLGMARTQHMERAGGGGRHIQWSPEIQGPLAVMHRLLTARDGEGGGVSSSPLALESWLHQPPHSFSEIKETVSPQHCWTPLFLPWSAVLRCPRHYRLTNLPCRSNSFLWLILSIYLKLSDSHG